MFSRFCRVEKIAVAAIRLAGEENGGEKTFPEQEKLSNGNDDLPTKVNISSLNFRRMKRGKKEFLIYRKGKI